MSRFNVYCFLSDDGKFSPNPFVAPSVHHLFVSLAVSYKEHFFNRDKLRSEPLYKVAEFDDEKGVFVNIDKHELVISSGDFKHLFSLTRMSDGLDLLLSEFGALSEDDSLESKLSSHGFSEGGAVGDTSPEVAERKQTFEDVSPDELKDWE